MSKKKSVPSTLNQRSIVPAARKLKRPKYDIRELVKRLPADYSPEEVKWGKPVGKEVWWMESGLENCRSGSQSDKVMEDDQRTFE